MRTLGLVIAAASAACLAVILFLAHVVPAWMQQARESGRPLAAPEAMLYDLSNLATSFGFPGLLVAALGFVVGLVLIVKGRKPRQA
jgi:type II secretory pathway component PulF